MTIYLYKYRVYANKRSGALLLIWHIIVVINVGYHHFWHKSGEVRWCTFKGMTMYLYKYCVYANKRGGALVRQWHMIIVINVDDIDYHAVNAVNVTSANLPRWNPIQYAHAPTIPSNLRPYNNPIIKHTSTVY